MFVDTKKKSLNFIFNKCENLFNNCQDELISEEDYEWLGGCSIKVAQNASEEEKTRYWEMLKKASEANPFGTTNYGIFVSLLDHFKSLIIFPRGWYK